MLIADPLHAARYDALFLSPHLDDVALSCPLRVRNTARGGARVLVATFFSAGPDAATRRAEDSNAMARLGVDHCWLDLPDAPARSAIYRSFCGIVFGRDPSDEGVASLLRERLRALIEAVGPTSVHAPLAVGGHIDHRLLFEAVRDELPHALFYEDRPYALVRHAVHLRLLELEAADGARHPPPDRLLAELLESFHQTPYVRSYLREPAEVAECRRRYAILAARGQTGDRRARAVTSSWPARDISDAVLSAEPYASQLDEVVGGLDRYRADLTNAVGPAYRERFWTLTR